MKRSGALLPKEWSELMKKIDWKVVDDGKLVIEKEFHVSTMSKHICETEWIEGLSDNRCEIERITLFES